MEDAQQVLDQLCERRGIPGAVFGVVEDGVVTIATYGTRQPQHRPARRSRDPVPRRFNQQEFTATAIISGLISTTVTSTSTRHPPRSCRPGVRRRHRVYDADEPSSP